MAERVLTHTRYLGAVDHRSSVELTEMQLALADTMATPGWNVLLDLWHWREAQLTDELVRLRSEASRGRFIEKAAEVRGLQEAQTAHEALAEVAERKRREAEEHHG